MKMDATFILFFILSLHKYAKISLSRLNLMDWIPRRDSTILQELFLELS